MHSPSQQAEYNNLRQRGKELDGEGGEPLICVFSMHACLPPERVLFSFQCASAKTWSDQHGVTMCATRVTVDGEKVVL